MNGKLGNVHSGATPPWLRDDDDDKGTSPSSASSVTFGPSLDEFIKHSKLVVPSYYYQPFLQRTQHFIYTCSKSILLVLVLSMIVSFVQRFHYSTHSINTLDQVLLYLISRGANETSREEP